MLKKRLLHGIVAIIGVLSLIPSFSYAVPITSVLLGDQTLDQILRLQDLNNDGDANDVGEMKIFFDGSNASGLISPTGSVLSITSTNSGHQYYSDGNTDAVYQLRDINNDGDALDASEARVWFSADNDAGLPLLTPNGTAEGADGAIYVVEADVRSNQNGDFVYRTEDLNGDGDANDAGEASVWLDLKALNLASSPFEINFDGDTAYIADTVGSEPNVIYRARDEDGNGVVDANEVGIYIDESNPFGIPIDFAFDAIDGDLFVWEFLDFSGPQSIFQLTDLDASQKIDLNTEIQEIWNTDYLPPGFATFAAFAVAAGPNGELMLTSNGFANEDNLIRLLDLNFDGDYFDDGETIIFASNAINGIYPVRARSLAYMQAIAVSTPGSITLWGVGLFIIGAMRRKN